MPKQRSYGFLTTTSNLIEVKASSPQQGFRRAEKQNKIFMRKFKKLVKANRLPTSELNAQVTKSYLTYGRSGFAPVGIYKHVRTKKR